MGTEALLSLPLLLPGHVRRGRLGTQGGCRAALGQKDWASNEMCHPVHRQGAHSPPPPQPVPAGDREDVQPPQSTVAKPGQDVKDRAFPREPSCTHLAHSVATQQAIRGRKCNRLPADGQHTGSLRLMFSHARRACSGTIAFGAETRCLGRVSSSSNAHRLVQGMRSGVPRGTPCSRGCLGASHMS